MQTTVVDFIIKGWTPFGLLGLDTDAFYDVITQQMQSDNEQGIDVEVIDAYLSFEVTDTEDVVIRVIVSEYIDNMTGKRVFPLKTIYKRGIEA